MKDEELLISENEIFESKAKMVRTCFMLMIRVRFLVKCGAA